MNRLIIIGAGGHGKVVADIAVKAGYKDVVFLDDGTIQDCVGFPVIGKTALCSVLEGDKIVAVGNAQVRERFQNEMDAITLVHPDAVIGIDVKISSGTVIMAGAVVNSCTVIGEGCIINTCASVDHDCKLGNFVHIAVGAHLAGDCVVGERTWIGAGATVNNGVRICGDCIIGAGAVVIRDINEQGTYVGCPARRIK